MIKKNIVLLIVLSWNITFCSDKELLISEYFNSIINLNYEKAVIKISDLKSKKIKEGLITLSNLLYYNGQNECHFNINYDITTDNSLLNYIFYLNNGYYKLYYNKRKSEVFQDFFNAYIIAKHKKNNQLIKFSLLSILELYHYQYSQTNNQFKKYLSEYRNLAKMPIEKCWLLNHEIYFNSQNINAKERSSAELLKDLENQTNLLEGDHRFKPLFFSLKAIQTEVKAIPYELKNDKEKLHQNLGIITNLYDEAINLHKKTISISKDYPFFKYLKFRSYFRLSILSNKKRQYEQGLHYINLAKKFLDSSNLKQSYIYINRSSAQSNHGLKQDSLAYIQLYKSINSEHELGIEKNTFHNSTLQIQLETTEKEKKIVQLLNTNLKSEANRVRNRDLLIGAISFIAIGLLITLLLYKNIKRKQRIAEQQHEIELQKTEKLLKEQELSAIDAMILGQEKERQRLANDLHDNLGSTLATVKLHFQHLRNNKDNPKIKNIEELYSKTDTLLEEAYQKVRTIAHEKNSGVMANQGLLLAIKNLAKKVSNGNLLVEVQDYGLEQRLDNALEITIFRMIQELVTNAIKHAKATEIHISLTNHDSLLNIIVEDNGKGFDTRVLPKKEGMGLATIEKRVEHLEGTFEMDSTLGKGTNIIINIPI